MQSAAMVEIRARRRLTVSMRPPNSARARSKSPNDRRALGGVAAGQAIKRQ